ncbi:MAG: sigma-70 family RNA polymerase sigma factor [candidate division Zixibacteria bacterium]|nr:sigma-70 family RNA polymerase sigma factor [candidate division Zixibacteria bacterium]
MHFKHSKCTEELSLMDLNQLFADAKKGDKKAESLIYNYLFERFKFLVGQKINTNDVEDIAQEACMTLLSKYKAMEGRENFESWAYSILKNKIGNYLQLRRVEREELSDKMDDIRNPDRGPIDIQIEKRLNDCIKEIISYYPRYARALNLAYQGYKADEICEKMDIKPNNFYVILNRGRNLLRNCLEMGRIKA